MVSNYIPKVGDKVIITKSDRNWVSDMNEYIGKEAILTRKQSDKDYFSINLESTYSWSYKEGHFKPINTNQIYELW